MTMETAIMIIALIVTAIGAVIVRWPDSTPATGLPVRIDQTGLNPDFCPGCGHVHRSGAMAFTPSGAYRCRICCYGREL